MVLPWQAPRGSGRQDAIVAAAALESLHCHFKNPRKVRYKAVQKDPPLFRVPAKE
jgi:hypothetical protein